MSPLGAPEGLVARVSETLERLRDALPKSPGLAVSSILYLADRPRVLESLQAILQHADRGNLEAQGALAGLVTEYRSAALASELRELFLALQSCWERRVSEKLGPSRISTLRRLLAVDVPDFLELLGKVNDENANSNVLAWLLTPRHAPTVAPAALERLAALLDQPRPDAWKTDLHEAIRGECISVRREVVFGREWVDEDSRDRLDVLITGPRFVLVVENKLWSREHSGQTEGYWRWLSRQPGLCGGIFLSPAGDPPLTPGFKAISYMDLLACLLEGPASGAALAAQEELVLASYVKTLARRVLRAELRVVCALGGS
jgi:hypothetical protein